MTLGLDSRWRRQAVRQANPVPGERWLDMCSGTGETALLLDTAAGAKIRTVAADFSLPMLGQLKGKLTGGNAEKKVFPVCADAVCLPFSNDVFDGVTISFATRNLTPDESHLKACLAEFFRILKPGGRFIHLETSQPVNPVIRYLFHLFIRMYSAPSTRLISGSRNAYRYLVGSMMKFYDAKALSRILSGAGFTRLQSFPMLMGAIALHSAEKPV